MQRFGVTESDLQERIVTPQFKDLMKFEIERARKLYLVSDFGIYKLPPKMRKAVLLSRLLYSQILDRIEAQDYDVFRQRARTNSIHKAKCAMRVMLKDKAILTKLVADSGVRV